MGKKFEKYKEGFILKEDEYLLKVNEYNTNEFPDTGFMAKLNKDDSIPANFKNWNKDLPIYKITEKFRPGWELSGWRFGMSRNWAILIHPLGFTVEIHMEHFLTLVQETTIIEGVIQGEFKWDKTKLIGKI